MIETTPGASRPQAISCAQSAPNGSNCTYSTDFGGLALRLLAIGCGVAILGASTGAVVASGKLAGPDAALAWALAAGVAMGAVVVSRSEARLAAALVAALVCGESFNLLSTADRIVATRDAAAAVITGANDRHAEAAARLKRAEIALTAQRDAAAEAVTLASCAAQCRLLLQSQSTDLVADVEAARKSLNAAPPARTASPLADRLGLPPWALDLLAAALLSAGANGLAAVLLCWGATPRGTRCETARRAVPIDAQNTTPAVVPTFQPLAASKDGTHDDYEPPQPPGGGLPHPVSSRTRGVLALIEGAGGEISGAQRDIAQRVGLSKSALGRALSELAASGSVTITTDRVTGTRIALKAA